MKLPTPHQPKRFVVYFPNWAFYTKAHKFSNPGMIPWDKVSVINHAFYEVNKEFKLASTDRAVDEEQLMYHPEAGGLKGHLGVYGFYKPRYPNVKLLISVGGWTRGNHFHDMAKTLENRAIFINSMLDFLNKYPFIDGIDIDWEFPGINRQGDPNDSGDRGCPGGPEDKQNFSTLLREIREAYNNNGMKNKLLTIAAPANYNLLDHQEPDKYAQYLDWINVMTYDMHSALEEYTNHHSAIYANPADPSPCFPVDIKNNYNVDFIMKYFRDHFEIPASRLNVGSPYYSRGWANIDPNTGHNGLFAKAKGAPVGNLDSPSNPAGLNSYGRMIKLEKTPGYLKYRDAESLVPWLYNKAAGIMYTYEDETSAAARCDYVLKNDFGGIIVWEITTDTEDFALTNTISEKLQIHSKG